ncbi:MAG: class A beta-lactamase-related serine hydrolase [Chloroflexota bacterium]|nr:class A beta-lactamase-related serine hydrolase [Chloroflexota bacterium]
MGSASAWSRVEEVVAEVSQTGTVGVSIIGPDGATWQRFGDRKFPPASTLKIPVMVEIYRKVDAGAFSLDDSWTLTDDDRVIGSGVLNHMRSGATITYEDLIYLMISISDNLATDVLINTAGVEAVNRTMADLGMKNSRLGGTIRMLFDGTAAPSAATPNDYAGAIAAILDGRAASAASCEAMTKMLEKQQNHRRIARYLPPAMPLTSEIRFGSKTGTTRGVCNEAGFIMGPNGRLIIAVYTENYPDTHTGEQVIGEIARAALADTGVAAPMYTS